MKTTEMTGAALDWAVAKCEGRKPSYHQGVVRATAHPDFPASAPMFGPELIYSTNWAQGGPIIEREGITLASPTPIASEWCAMLWGVKAKQSGTTPLIAAMRCFVASKLGDNIEIPKELTT
jgi:hypothetical protein